MTFEKPQEEKNDPQIQINLAKATYKFQNGEDSVEDSMEGENKIMFAWTGHKDGEKSYSECYRDIISNKGFKEHPRFKNDQRNITVQDILYYKEHERLPDIEEEAEAV